MLSESLKTDNYQDLISVIVPVFNVEPFLPKCLASISEQTYRNLEILLIDDGSTDGSGIICDVFAAKDVRARVIHQENRGLWAARNRGQLESRGNYLVFPDGDDYFHKDYIRFLYEAINYEGIEHSIAICGFLRAIDDSGDLVSEITPSYSLMNQKDLMEKVLSIPFCSQIYWGGNWNKLYRRDKMPQPFQREYRRGQDYDSNLRYFYNVDSAVLLHANLYYWRQHPNQITRSPDFHYILNECRTDIYFNHLSEIPHHLTDYKHYLYINLYSQMYAWKNQAKRTKKEDAALKTIRDIEKKTILPFLFCRNESLFHKVHLLLALHFPKTESLFQKARTRIVNLLH